MSVFNVQKDSDYFDRKFPNNTLHSIKSNLSDLQSNEKKCQITTRLCSDEKTTDSQIMCAAAKQWVFFDFMKNCEWEDTSDLYIEWIAFIIAWNRLFGGLPIETMPSINIE